MKKQLVLLPLFLFSSSQLFPLESEIKIYRKKASKAAIIGISAGIVLLAAVGAWITWEYHGALKRYKKSWDYLNNFLHHPKKTIMLTKLGYLMGAAISSIGIIPSSTALAFLSYDFHKWNSKRDKPFIIFDTEGFIYEISQGRFRESIDIRFYWKDVKAQWDETIKNSRGAIIEKKWCYRVVDHATKKEHILKIDAMELDIPQEMAARVEAVHQGKVAALTA